MGLKLQRRLAASILKVGENRIWVDPNQVDKVAAAIRRKDVEMLIKDGTIKVLPKRGISKRERRKRRGPGSIKGAKGTRMPRKRRWIKTIRALRIYLKKLKEEGKLSKASYLRLYRMAKGGMFRSKSHLQQYIKSHREELG